MIDDGTIGAAQTYVRACFAGDASGHDVHHTLRVWCSAVRIAAKGDQILKSSSMVTMPTFPVVAPDFTI